jgi:hypothetical protein
MNTKEKLILLRNIFYKCFFVGLFFLIAAILLYMPCKCFLANFYQIKLGIPTNVYYNMWAGFIGLIKTILIFLFLVPAIAIHWATKEHSKK